MDKLLKAVKSRTIWTIVVIVLLNAIPQLRDLFPSQAWVDTVNGLLLALAAYYKISPSQNYN